MTIAYVTGSRKRQAIGQDFGMSRSRINQILQVVFRVLECGDERELSFLIGQHWNELAALQGEPKK